MTAYVGLIVCPETGSGSQSTITATFDNVTVSNTVNGSYLTAVPERQVIPVTGGTSQYGLTVNPMNVPVSGSTTVTFAATGLPAGVTASFSPATVTASVDGTGKAIAGATTMTLNSGALAAGTYGFVVTATAGGASTEVKLVLEAGGTDGLPAGWYSDDIGKAVAGSGASYSNGVYTVTGGPTSMGGNYDEFRFVYRALQGNGTIVARVAGLPTTGTFVWSRVALMLRDGPSPTSSYFMIGPNDNGGSAGIQWIRLGQWRTSLGAGIAGNNPNWPLIGAPYWFKIERQGNLVIGSGSTNGSNWEEMGRVTLPLGPTAYVGLAVSPEIANGSQSTITATFDNVTVQ
ncbi:MAG: hypothetical protein HYX27_02735 [Acidobacteria bacterium]|nr:hypothetical protein [Acidobacteriota bacterium]